MLSQRMKDFIGGALSIDGAAADPQSITSFWREGPNPARDEVETGMRELLRTRELTTREYCAMTGVDFDSENELYRYLQNMYDYLFRGAQDAPEIPD